MVFLQLVMKVNLSMGRKELIEKYQLRITLLLHPSGMNTNHPKYNAYEPTDVISEKEWNRQKKTYRVMFAPLSINIEVIEGYLDEFWNLWKNGVYPNQIEFRETVFDIFQEFADALQDCKSKEFTDEEVYDDLFQQFQTKVDEITWDGSKDWERTWDGRIYNDILKEDAKKIESQINRYLRKRIKHGLELTDNMKSFKGCEDIWFEKNKSQIGHRPTPEQIKKAQAPEPTDADKSKLKSDLEDVTAELRNARNIAKNVSKEKNQYKRALEIHRNKPNQFEMKEIIDRCRFKNGKCNNTKVGNELGIDGETALAWIKNLKLSDYAYNPDHIETFHRKK